MKKQILTLMLVLAATTCFVAFAYGYSSSTTVTPSTNIANGVETAHWTPSADNPATKVTFQWFDPANNLMQTTVKDPIVPGTPQSDTFTIPAAGPTGQWYVKATAGTVTQEISFEIQPFTVSVPEIAVLGTIGAAFAMIGAVVYRKRTASKV